jgi:hypothetical protein
MEINANNVIDKLGGTGVTARLCETSPGAVSQWRRDGIPPARLMYLKLARPDVFEIGASDTAPEPVQQAA